MKPNLWPIAIIAYFTLFISGVVTWVSFAMRHDEQLVRPDYYAHEINYQKQIDRLARTAALPNSVELHYNPFARSVALGFPADGRPLPINGEIQFYRPSDSRKDTRFSLQVSKGNPQLINVAALSRGFWKVRITWSDERGEYYLEKPVVLAGTEASE